MHESLLNFAARMLDCKGLFYKNTMIPSYIEHDEDEKQTYLVICTHREYEHANDKSTYRKFIDSEATRAGKKVTIKFPLGPGIVVEDEKGDYDEIDYSNRTDT